MEKARPFWRVIFVVFCCLLLSGCFQKLWIAADKDVTYYFLTLPFWAEATNHYYGFFDEPFGRSIKPLKRLFALLIPWLWILFMIDIYRNRNSGYSYIINYIFSALVSPFVIGFIIILFVFIFVIIISLFSYAISGENVYILDPGLLIFFSMLAIIVYSIALIFEPFKRVINNPSNFIKGLGYVFYALNAVGILFTVFDIGGLFF